MLIPAVELLALRRKIYTYTSGIHFPEWLRNRLISAGLEPVLSHTEESLLQTIFHEY